jgi:hypothetical protein
MKFISPRRAAPLLALLLLAGCMASTPRLDRQFGDTVRQAVARQTLAPLARHNPDPVAGTDGRSAVRALQQYEKTYSEPAPGGGVFTIGVSGK